MDEVILNFRKKLFSDPRVKQEWTMWENIQGFYHAIDWTEPWIIGILVSHVLILAAVVRWRHHMNFQLASFVGISAIVFCAQYVNEFLGRRWRAFAGQNYFDPNGLFLSVMVSAPLLCIVFLQLIMALATSAQLVIKVKRAELKASLRAKGKKGGGPAAAGKAGSTATESADGAAANPSSGGSAAATASASRRRKKGSKKG